MGGVQVGSVVIDCNDFDRMFAFWRDALGYVPRDEPEDDWVVLHDPSGSNVNVSLQVVPEPRVGKNRLHLDLYAGTGTPRSSGCSASARRSTLGRPSPTRTSSSSPIPRAISFVSSRRTVERSASPCARRSP
jgi:hypothetical protein